MVRMSKQQRDKARTIVYVHDFLAFVSVLSAKESSARKLAGTVSVTGDSSCVCVAPVLTLPPSTFPALYEVFDTDGDGYATKQDLARVFKVLRGAAYSSSQHMELVMGCMVQADVNADGRMSFREFARVREGGCTTVVVSLKESCDVHSCLWYRCSPSMTSTSSCLELCSAV